MKKRRYNHANDGTSLKISFIMNMLLNMSSFIFPLITFPYVSRILLPFGTGKVSFAESLISYFTIFAQLGIPTYGIRRCAQVREDREKLTRAAHELLFLNLVMCALAYLVLAVVLLTVPKLYNDRELYVIISMAIILSAIGMEWLYKALEQYVYITLRSLLCKLVALIAMFLLIHRQEDYVIYGGITIMAASMSNIFNLLCVHKYIDIKPVGEYNVKRHLRPIFIFFAMSCATTVYTNMDAVMLGFLASEEDVGYYNAAVKMKAVLVSVVTSLGAVLLPRASYYIECGMRDRFEAVTRKALNFVFLTAVPLMTYFILYAKEGIYLLSGPAYAYSVLPMKIIMPTLLLIGITKVLGLPIMVPLGKETAVLCSEIAGAAVNVVINALLIPRFASVGAAIGTVAAEFVVLVVQYTALKSDVSSVFRTTAFWKIGIGTALGAAGSCWVALLGLGNFLTLAISAGLFFGVYGIVLLITKEAMTMELFEQVVDKIKKLHQ